VADFICYYSLDSFFESMVVVFPSGNAHDAVEDALFVVDWLGFLYGCSAKMGI